MPSGITSARQIKAKPKPYERFIGLETIRDESAQDLGSKQPLNVLSNGFIDDLGQVVRDPGVDQIQSASNVIAVRHLDISDIVWIENRGDGLEVFSTAKRNAKLGWPVVANPSIASFNNRLLIMAVGLAPWEYAGAAFAQLPANGPMTKRLRPAFGVTVQSRFVAGGMPQYPGVIEVSRVNDLKFFSEEEKDDEESVLRGGKIDIRSLIGTRENITGLYPFETNKLIIFTGDRGLIYRLSTDIDAWALEDRVSISAGCISHDTIVSAGPDVLYCSRTGIHSVMRSRENGTMVYSMPLSGRISLLYRNLVRMVADVKQISAVWDQDENQYHVFFPRQGSTGLRLTMTIDPADPAGSPRFSLSDGFVVANCGHFFEGSLVFGSSDGLYQIGKVEEDFRALNPDLVLETPPLYLGSLTDPKSINGLIVSAAGKSSLLIEAIKPETGEVFKSINVEVTPDADPANFKGTALIHQRLLPFQARTTSLKVRITAKGKGLFRLAGFAFLIEEG